MCVQGVDGTDMYIDGSEELIEFVECVTNRPAEFLDLLENMGPVGVGMARILRGEWDEAQLADFLEIENRRLDVEAVASLSELAEEP
jgi:hypothetical protein